MALSYHTGPRGLIGYLLGIVGGDGVNRIGVVPAVSIVDSAGNPAGGGSAGSPTVVGAPTGVTPTARSSTITAGGTAQQLMAANASRKGWSIFNQSSGNLYINDLGAATADNASMLIGPGVYYFPGPGEYVSTAALSIIGATTGQAFYAREW